MMAWDQELSSGLIFLTFMSVQFFQVAHVYDRAPLSVPLHSYCSILPPMADVLSDLSENPDIVDEISRMAEDPSVVAEMQRRGLSLEAVGRFSKLLQMQSTGAEDIAAERSIGHLRTTTSSLLASNASVTLKFVRSASGLHDISFQNNMNATSKSARICTSMSCCRVARSCVRHW